MLASGLVDSDNLVGQIRWERRFHIIIFLATMAGLTLFATTGMDFPNPDAPGPIEGSWEWLRYTLVISTVVAPFVSEVYLLFSYNSFYAAHFFTNVYAIAVLGWNAVCMLIIITTCDTSQYPQCSLSKFAYTVRFCTALALLGLRIAAFWNASNLRATVSNIRRIRTVLIDQNKIAVASGGKPNEIGELYAQIRNEQVLHVIVMLYTAVSWGFFAVSEMWIAFRNGSDDAWVTFIWWREFSALCALAPLAISQIYFLLGGTITRAMTRWTLWAWSVGVLPVCAIYLLIIYDNCNERDLSLNLIHPECGSPNPLDDSVQAEFIWRICSFFALYIGTLMSLLVFNTVTHSLMALALLKKSNKKSDDPEDGEQSIESRFGRKTRSERLAAAHAELKSVHHKAFKAPTVSQMIHSTNDDGLFDEVMSSNTDMLLFSGRAE